MLLRQTILYLPAQLVGPLAQFVSVVLWTYFLSPKEMGIFALVSAAQEFAFLGTLFWFTLYTTRYYNVAARVSEKQDFLNTERAAMLGAGVVSTLGVLTMPLFISVDWTWPLLTGSVAYCVTRSIASHLSDRARTASDTVSYSVLQIAWPILSLALGYVFVRAFAPTAACVLWGYTVAQLVTLAAVIPRLEFGKQTKMSRDLIATALRYSLPLVFGGGFLWLANNGIRFVIEQSEGAAAVGLVTVGWGLGLRVAAFAAMLVTAAAFPIAVRRSREHGLAHGQQQLLQNGILLLAILAPSAAGLWAISQPLVERIVAEPFQAMTTAVLPWAIIAGAARNLRTHFGAQVFLLREETMTPLVNDVIDGLATLTGGAVGLTMAGLTGSVIGAAMGSIVALAATLAAAGYRHQFFFPMAHLMKIGAATLTMVLTLHVLPISSAAMSLAAGVCFGATVYGVVMAALYPDVARRLFDKAKAYTRA